MSCAMFQPKLWDDHWNDLVWDKALGWIDVATGETYESPEEYSAKFRTVWAQVWEMECWPDDPSGGMTQGMVKNIETKFGDHQGTIVALGDASGNQRRSSSTTTDWQIIGESMSRFRDPVVIRGPVANSDLRTGVTTYSNPAQRDALMNANRMLIDAEGKVNVCFLRESPLASGGVAAAVTAMGYTPEGHFDTKNERKADRDVARTHFGDVYKYFSWYALPPNQWQSPDKGMNSVSREVTRDRFRSNGW
jgi:hypothetical protein